MIRNNVSIVVILILANGIMSFASAHEPGYEITIPQINVPPRIDGVLDDAVWKTAKPVEWGNINTGGEVKKDQFTRSWAVYDNEYIYTAFENMEPNTGKLVMAFLGHDTDVWRDDAGELFIEPRHVGREPYFQIVINAANVTYDNENGGTKHLWEPRLESATRIYKDRWVLEVSIQFKDLGFSKTPIGETWGWNFNRHIVTGVDIWTGWAKTGSSFHTPNRFGNLTFGMVQTTLQSLDKLVSIWGGIKSCY
ncbi:MAG: hypothetical protein QG670_2671 [Thermoproteota archaeon]|nr:hypothetical protein [Thermoproteota archaeon]